PRLRPPAPPEHCCHVVRLDLHAPGRQRHRGHARARFVGRAWTGPRERSPPLGSTCSRSAFVQFCTVRFAILDRCAEPDTAVVIIRPRGGPPAIPHHGIAYSATVYILRSIPCVRRSLSSR